MSIERVLNFLSSDIKVIYPIVLPLTAAPKPRFQDLVLNFKY